MVENTKLVWYIMGDAKHNKGVNLQLELWEEEKAQGTECCSTSTYVGYLERSNIKAFERGEMNFVKLRSCILFLIFFVHPRSLMLYRRLSVFSRKQY